MIDSDLLFSDKKDFKAGYVSIIGAPNAGKSTLLNLICGEKLAITTDKPQTTRNKILAVVNTENAQIVFLDTPGIHSSEKVMNRRLVAKATEAAEESDAVVYVVDTSKKSKRDDDYIVEKLKTLEKKVILILNKIDLLETRDKVLAHIDSWRKKFSFTDIIPVSASKGINTDNIISAIENILPFGTPFYPEDFLTDMPIKFIASEIIREKIFILTRHEIPYSTAVTVESFKEKSGVIEIDANINIERDSQKGVIIGKKGSMLTEIGTKARLELEDFTGQKVVLRLFVKVHRDWTKKPGVFREYGIE